MDTARARCAAGARPGGASPARTAPAASISRRRVLTMPLSEENEMLPGAVLDRSHAFLYGGVLDADAEHAGKSLLGILRRAVDQIVVAPVRDRDEGTFDQRP